PAPLFPIRREGFSYSIPASSDRRSIAGHGFGHGSDRNICHWRRRGRGAQQMQKIKSVNVLQTAKVMAAIYFILGLAVCVLIIFVGLIEKGGVGPRRLVTAILSLFFYGIAGFVFTAIFCWLYNIIAARLGGIEIDLIEPRQPGN